MSHQPMYNDANMPHEKPTAGEPQAPPPAYDQPMHPQYMQPQHTQAQYQQPQQMQPGPMQPMPMHDHAHAHRPAGKWSFGLFDCCSPIGLCCATYWCPCYVFGKTHAREKSGEHDPSGMNGMCVAFCCLMYLGAVPFLQCINRTQMREKYHIEGSSCGDFCSACCCGCCVVIQEEKESVARVCNINPKTQEAYDPPAGMAYP